MPAINKKALIRFYEDSLKNHPNATKEEILNYVCNAMARGAGHVLKKHIYGKKGK